MGKFSDRVLVYELEALVRVARLYTQQALGEDPLAGTLYDADNSRAPQGNLARLIAKLA